MSELVSAYPTSGGIYWWAAKLGGPAAGFFTGWLNLIGLVAVTAVGRLRRATSWTSSSAPQRHLGGQLLPTRVFIVFVVILVLRPCSNIFSSHLLAVINNVSVWWHVVGAAVIVLILIFVPDQPPAFS